MISVSTTTIMPSIEKLEKKLNIRTSLEQDLFLKVFNRVAEVISPKYSYKKIDFSKKPISELIAKSKDLSSLLLASKEGFVVVCTLGHEITSVINDYQKEAELACALYADKIASDAVENLIEYVSHVLLHRFFDTNKYKLTRRYSPGYGDLSLDKQRELFSLFEAEELEVSLNAKNFMIPEKSISCLVGVYSDR